MTLPKHQPYQKHVWLLCGLAPLFIATPLQAQSQEIVIWDPVIKDQAYKLQMLVPSNDGRSSSTQSRRSESEITQRRASLKPVTWELVPDPKPSDHSDKTESSSNDVVWEPSPNNSPAKSNESKELPTNIIWELLPESLNLHTPKGKDTISEIYSIEPAGNFTSSKKPPAVVTNQEKAFPPRIIKRPSAPALHSLNRSIAYGDGFVGPDISWHVPNGFRWSRSWFADASIQKNNQTFGNLNTGDSETTTTIHTNILHLKKISFGINTTFQNFDGGYSPPKEPTQLGVGISNGFRLAMELGKTGGVALGGEQIIKWDGNRAARRNFYFMASKGWWLKGNGKNYPLLIANGGFGTGQFANQSVNNWQNPLRFACVSGTENRSGRLPFDNDLCWSPIGTISLVMNEWWSMFVEYRSGTALAGASMNLTGGVPLRLTLGVNFAEKNEIQNIDSLSWVFRASYGF